MQITHIIRPLRWLSMVLLAYTLLQLQACEPDENVPPEYDHTLSVGKSAADIVSDKNYRYMLVELQHFPGMKPTERAMGFLTDFLEQHCQKPDGITLLTKEIPSENQQTYSTTKIRQLENANREYYTSGDTLCVYFVCVDADYAENDEDRTVLGIAYRNTSMCLFQRTILDQTGGLGKPRQDIMEATVLNHEFGHILGLVNVNDDMVHDHQDEAHGNHCDDDECLMYYTVGLASFATDLTGRTVPPTLDQHCLDDLAALQ